MSDDNMSDNEEDYDLEYSEDDDSQPDVDLENQYYNSKVSVYACRTVLSALVSI